MIILEKFCYKMCNRPNLNLNLNMNMNYMVIIDPKHANLEESPLVRCLYCSSEKIEGIQCE